MLLVLIILYPDLVAQAATDAGPWLTALNLGLAGIGLWAFATGRIVAHGTHQRTQDRLDAAEAEIRSRNEDDRRTLIPALIRATDILAQYVERRDDTPPPPPKASSRR